VGTVGGDRLVVRDLLDLPLEDIDAAFDGGLTATLGR
jgi:hypothetical protein